MNRKTLIWLIAIIAFGFILRLIFFSGIATSDDLLYTSYAYDMSKDSYSFPERHQGTRLGLVYSVSVFYKLFGINDISSVLFVFLTSIAGIILIYCFGKTFFNEKVGLVSAFLLSFFPLDVIFATKLLSDLPSAFFLSLGVFFFLFGEKTASSLKTKISYLASGLFIGIAYLIRETALIVLIFFIAYAVFYKKARLNYLFIFLGFIPIFLIESYIFLINTGDFLFRYHILSAYSNVAASYGFFGRAALPYSLFYYPYIILTSLGKLGIFYPFMLVSIIYAAICKKKGAYPLIIWLISLLLYLSFGTTSLTSYIPFFATPRYLMIITFPGILLLAYFLTDMAKAKRKLIAPLILGILLITSIGFVYLDKDGRQSTDNLKSIYPFISQLDKPVYTDARTKMALEYLSGYSKDIELKELNLWSTEKNIDADLKSIREEYILINYKMIKGIVMAHPDIKFPEEVHNLPEDWIVIKKLGATAEDTVLYYAP